MERISNQGKKTTEITPSKQKKENILKKLNRSLKQNKRSKIHVTENQVRRKEGQAEKVLKQWLKTSQIWQETHHSQTSENK